MKNCHVIDNSGEVVILEFGNEGEGAIRCITFDSVEEAEEYAKDHGIVITGEPGDYSEFC